MNEISVAEMEQRSKNFLIDIVKNYSQFHSHQEWL